MNHEKNKFVGYEYKEIVVKAENISTVVDCYENFGWEIDEKKNPRDTELSNKIVLKRDRKIANKMELTRLQRNYESCENEISKLERQKSKKAEIWSIAIGVIGTACMACSTFAITNEEPMVVLCILFAIPGFLGWLFPYFIYRKIYRQEEKRVQPFIQDKEDEIYSICEKGHELL